MERSSLVARVTRQLVIANVVLAFCLANRAQAQTILPITLEPEIERKVFAGAAARMNPRLDGGRLNSGKAFFDFQGTAAPPDTGGSNSSLPQEEGKKPRDDADVGGTGPPQTPALKNDRWRNRTAFNWDGALRQSFFFLSIQHAFRLADEESTRAELGGPFFKDYFKALRSLRGWDDGDPFLVNYIGHPMMGSVSGFIQVQNDPRGIHEEVSLKKSYWTSRMRALGWSFAYSTQFELGLISEASIGNIGIKPNGKSNHAMAYVDLVVTPVVGTGWMVGEDALDKYFIRRFENRLPNRTTVILFRSFLNPTRSFANVMRGKWPWYRDGRP
jgi:hypothetical protein